MKTLNFSYNWNNKLNCKSFSTVRIENPSKYVLIDEYQIILTTSPKKEPVNFGVARLQSINSFYLHQVTPAVSFLDANLPVIDFIELVQKMYKNSNIDFKKQKISFLVFQYIK